MSLGERETRNLRSGASEERIEYGFVVENVGQ